MENQPGEDAHHVGQDDEHRDHDEAGQHPGHDEVRARRPAQALQRVDLLGDPHGPQLGGVARADPAGEHQPGEHRPQLQHDGLDDHAGEIVDREWCR